MAYESEFMRRHAREAAASSPSDPGASPLVRAADLRQSFDMDDLFQTAGPATRPEGGSPGPEVGTPCGAVKKLFSAEDAPAATPYAG